MDREVIVIGGGVIGLACANALLRAGRAVRVLEREVVGAGASHGNCGLVTPSHALPLTRPGMVRKALKWMRREDSPIYVQPRFDLEFFSWGLRFAGNCRPGGLANAIRGRAALLESSRDLYVEWIERDGLACEWEARGLIEVFATEERAAAEEESHRILAEYGVRTEPLTRDELLAREPALRPEMAAGAVYPRDAQLRPGLLVSELARVVRAKGGVIEEGREVVGLEREGRRVSHVRTTDGGRAASAVVLAAGAWSPTLARAFGVRLPIQAGKGYSITSARPDPCPTNPLLLAEANMAVTPWPSGLRLGGTMEFSGRNTTIRRARIDALRTGAARFLRTPLGEGPIDEWVGWRPMTPDELPILGPSPRDENVVLATGHGMMGVSMAPATAEVVAQLVTSGRSEVDLAPYAVDRF